MEIIKCNFKDVDLEFELDDEVFKPTATTRVLASSMKVPVDSVFIDVGCGVGYIGILAAKLGAKQVYAVDLEPEACELARKNAIRNNVSDKVDIRVGNLFEPLEDIVADVIVDDVSGIAGLIARKTKSYSSAKIPIAGDDGSWPTTEMLLEAPKYLTKKGKLYFPVLSLANKQRIMEEAENSFHYLNILETRFFPLEGEFNESMDYLKQLHEKGIIELVQKGSRLCWKLEIVEATKYGTDFFGMNRFIA